MELRGEKLLDLFDASLNLCPARLPFAPLGDIGNTVRRPDDVIVHYRGHDCDGAFRVWNSDAVVWGEAKTAPTRIDRCR